MTHDIKPRLKLWMSTDKAEGVFGDGKWQLLRAIQTCSSLSAAAEKLGISYRKAWGDLKKAEEHLDVALVSRMRGGSHGGESRLTEAGVAWVNAYARFRKDVEKAVSSSFTKHMQNLERRGA